MMCLWSNLRSFYAREFYIVSSQNLSVKTSLELMSFFKFESPRGDLQESIFCKNDFINVFQL